MKFVINVISFLPKIIITLKNAQNLHDFNETNRQQISLQFMKDFDIRAHHGHLGRYSPPAHPLPVVRDQRLSVRQTLKTS